MVAVQIVVFAAGIVLVLAVALSALRTMVLPRGQSARISRWVFLSTRRLFDLRARVADSYEARDRIMAIYAPISLVVLAGTWILMVVVAFAALFWATGSTTWRAAIVVSGSSVTTLGMDHPANGVGSGVAVLEALIGLAWSLC